MSLSLDTRRLAMLAEMGIPLPPQAAKVAAPDAAIDEQSPGLPVTPDPTPVSTPAPMPVRLPVRNDAPVSPAAIVKPTTPAMPSAVGHLGWAELRQAVASCEGCTLCQQRRNTVFGTGAPDPAPGEAPQVDWLIVGEAPGENEDLQGEPFVGQAGRLLDNMLKAVGLERHAEQAPGGRVYIANVLKCRPPGNRNPHPDEVARCEPYLRRQVVLLRPRIIVAMGRFAVQSLLRDSVADVESLPLGRLRGQAYAYEGVPVVVTYHPAYLLRNPIEKRKAWADLCLALSVANRPQG